MKEIEIKAKLVDRGGVVQKLKDLGCVLSESIRQEDVVYVENVGNLETFLANSVFLRTRVNNTSEIIFTAKKRIKGLSLVAIEHEVAVDSKEEMQKIIGMMGFQEAVRISKVRVTTEHNGCEICIDEVEGLGSFIEMEKMSESGDAKEIQEELFAFFRTLGVSPEDRVTKGYDILMFEKN